MPAPFNFFLFIGVKCDTCPIEYDKGVYSSGDGTFFTGEGTERELAGLA